MKCTLHSPSYLVRNAHSYCFRLIVPKDLRKFVGRTELRYTLRTGYLGVAKRKSRFLAGQVQFIFQSLRKPRTPSTINNKYLGTVQGFFSYAERN